MRTLVRCAAVVLFLTSTAVAPDAEVRAAMQRFLGALNRLDVDAMAACFTDDVTAFVPLAQKDRVNGKAAVVEIFKRFVEKVKPSTSNLNIVPEDLQVEADGNLAVVTFNVREKTVTRRRTFVFRRVAGGAWLISHFHASDL